MSTNNQSIVYGNTYVPPYPQQQTVQPQPVYELVKITTTVTSLDGKILTTNTTMSWFAHYVGPSPQ